MCAWGRAGCAARHDVESSRVLCPVRRGDAPRARIAHRVCQVSSASLETQGAPTTAWLRLRAVRAIGKAGGALTVLEFAQSVAIAGVTTGAHGGYRGHRRQLPRVSGRVARCVCVCVWTVCQRDIVALCLRQCCH